MAFVSTVAKRRKIMARLSRRELFAKAALEGMLARTTSYGNENDTAKAALRYADALIALLDNPSGNRVELKDYAKEIEKERLSPGLKELRAWIEKMRGDIVNDKKRTGTAFYNSPELLLNALERESYKFFTEEQPCMQALVTWLKE